MKKLIFCALLGFSSFAFSNEINQIVTIDDVFDSEFFQKLENIPEDKMDIYLFENWDEKNIILLKKDTTLPLKMFLKGEYFQLIPSEENNYPMATLKKDFYLQIKNKNFFFSEDLKKWDSASVFFTGSFNLGIKKSSDHLPQIEIGADINKR
ncbi:MAG: hypothetical protein K1060chlam5_00977 [Candidatus Anoxychlamydiales bacterium]|nr:hypothetical protein [Candidatus Anoxychlamydiales bacterium]